MPTLPFSGHPDQFGGVCLPVHFSPKAAFLAAREVNVSYNSDGRRKGFASSLALCALPFALSFASPARAESTTLLCPSENASNTPATYTVDLDYAASTIAIEEIRRGEHRHQFGPSAAVITDRTIKFELRDSSKEFGWPAGTWVTALVGSLDRLAGTLTFTETAFHEGHQEGSMWLQARCRPATQKF